LKTGVPQGTGGSNPSPSATFDVMAISIQTEKPRDIFLFILWEASRDKEEEILRDIAEHFSILKQFEIAWPQEKWLKHLEAFYGHCTPVWIAKARRDGTGNFRVAVVEDKNAVYDYRPNLRGQNELVDTNIWDAKKRYRKLVKSKDKVHSSVNLRETRHNLAMLLNQSLDDFLRRPDLDGKVQTLVTAPQPVLGWPDFRTFFYLLNECLPYVILRNAEQLRNPAAETKHGDIDILVSDMDSFISITGAVKTDSKPTHSAYLLPIGGTVAKFDVRYPGDGYYDPDFEREIVEHGQIVDGIRVPAPEDQFYSLLYHALLQKPAVAPDYAAYFKEAAPRFGLTGDAADPRTLETWLAGWLKAHNYKYAKPLNPKISLNPAYIDPSIPVIEPVRSRKHIIDCDIGWNHLKLHLFSGINMPNIFRMEIRLGGIWKMDFCLGDVKEVGL
jgi:hypothetical protein